MSEEELRARLATAEYPIKWGIHEFMNQTTGSWCDTKSDIDESESSEEDADLGNREVKELDSEDSENKNEVVIVDVYNRYCRNLSGFAFDVCHHDIDYAEDVIARNIKLMDLGDPFICKYSPALLNILWACCAHLSLERQNLKEAVQFLDKIVSLDEIQQAAIWGTCCSVLNLCGKEGKHKAGEYAIKAYEINKNEAVWSFLVGSNKADLRRFVYPLGFPTPEEIEFLERAYNLEKTNAKFAAYLGRTYNDCGLVLYYENMNDPSVEIYNKKAYDLHREAIELNKGKSAHILVVAARGLSRLPKKFNCLDEASQAMIQALERSRLTQEVPKSLSYHYLGLLSLKRQQFEEAAQYLRLSLDCGCVEAAWAYICTQLKLSPDYDPHNIYSKLLSFSSTQIARKELVIRTHVHAMCFYLFCQQDLPKAVHHFLQIADKIQNNPGIILSYFQVFSQWIFKSYRKLNPILVLCNQMKLSMELGKLTFSNGPLREALEKLRALEPEEMEKPPVHDLLEKLTLYEGKNREGSSQKGFGLRSGGQWQSRGGNWRVGHGLHDTVRIRENRPRVSRLSECSPSNSGYSLLTRREHTKSESAAYTQSGYHQNKETLTNWRTEARDANVTNYNWNNKKQKPRNENWRHANEGNTEDHQNVDNFDENYHHKI